MNFSVHLIQSIKDNISKLPTILIKINVEENNQMIDEIRKKIYEEFVKNEIVLADKVPNYIICGEEGDSRNLNEKFSYFKNNSELYFSAISSNDLAILIAKFKLTQAKIAENKLKEREKIKQMKEKELKMKEEV